MDLDLWAERWDAVKASYERGLENSDPRVRGWPMMESPWPTIAFFIAYLVMCYVGPSLMAKRKPFDLKPILIVYNFGLVVLSAYMFLEIYVTTKALNYTYGCDLVVYSDTSEPAIRLVSVIWLYYISKIVEFLDTLLFILRKKNNQITFLHIYHHSTMTLLWWIGTKWYAGGGSFFSAMLNSFVHIVMYSYYLLAALGPSVRKYLWWKKYLTMLQMLQFFLMLGHVSRSLYIGCAFDKRPQWALVIYLLSHLLLFSNFYRSTYLKPASKRSKGQIAEQAVVNGTPAASSGGHLRENGGVTSQEKEDKKDL